MCLDTVHYWVILGFANFVGSRSRHVREAEGSLFFDGRRGVEHTILDGAQSMLLTYKSMHNTIVLGVVSEGSIGRTQIRVCNLPFPL